MDRGSIPFSISTPSMSKVKKKASKNKSLIRKGKSNGRKKARKK